MTLFLAEVELTRPPDFELALGDHFAPMSYPAHRAGECEQDREHTCWDSESGEHDATIEIDVGVQFSRDEVLISEGDSF